MCDGQEAKTRDQKQRGRTDDAGNTCYTDTLVRAIHAGHGADPAG